MYIPDLELCQYHSGPFDAGNWSVPLRAVGWLEHPNKFPTGVTPTDLVPKLATLVQQMRQAFSHYQCRGTKTCSLCEASGETSPGPIWSQENLFVPGSQEVFIAPGGIVHYVEAHSYLPPESFIHAVLRCRNCETSDYLDALRVANAGIKPPLVSCADFQAGINAAAAAILGRRFK